MMPPQADSLVAFRANFPSLERLSWFDTPGSPPGAKPVIDAVRLALDSWERGDFSWTDWDAIPDLARVKVAALLGVDLRQIALVSSLSEAAATVAGSVPVAGKVVVASDEFRSNLLPWLALQARGVEIVSPEAGPTESLTERICASIVEGVSLVAVSSAVSSTGARPDLEAITRQADRWELGASSTSLSRSGSSHSMPRNSGRTMSPRMPTSGCLLRAAVPGCTYAPASCRSY